MKQLAQVTTQRPEYPFLAALRDEHHVVLAVPSRVAQALILFHREAPFSWQRSEIHADRRKGQTSVSPPAQPGVYLYELYLITSYRLLMSTESHVDLFLDPLPMCAS